MEKNVNASAENKGSTFADTSIKELIANPAIQETLKKLVRIPDKVLVKKVRNSYRPKDADKNTPKTQKIEAVYGTSIMDVTTIEMTLVGIELNEQAINHFFRIVDFSYSLNANMSGGNFLGYAPTGLKLMVTKLQEVNTHENAKSQA